METPAHRTLKRLATQFLLEAGCQAVAAEVACPLCRYRVDVAGYRDRAPIDPPAQRQALGAVGTLWDDTPAVRGARNSRSIPARTVFIECKQSRADFLRDSEAAAALLDARATLQARAREIERTVIEVREPHLRATSSFLFSELESWDYPQSRSPVYRRVMARLRALDRDLHGHTKFWMAARYRLADRLYLMAPAGMIRTTELPIGWGLLECDPAALRARPKAATDMGEVLGTASEFVQLVRPAPLLGSPDDRRARLLRNIAVAATRDRWSPRSGDTMPSRVSGERTDE